MDPGESHDDLWLDDMLFDYEEEEREDGVEDEEDKGERITTDDEGTEWKKNEDKDNEEGYEGPDKINNSSTVTDEHTDILHCGSGGYSILYDRTAQHDEMGDPFHMSLEGTGTERSALEGSETRSLNVFNVAGNSDTHVIGMTGGNATTVFAAGKIHGNVYMHRDDPLDKLKGNTHVIGMTGGNATTVFAAGNIHGNVYMHRDDPLDKLKDQSKLRLVEDLNMKLLVKTDKISECEKHIKICGMVTLIGGPGEGKTLAALYLLKQMSDTDSRQPLILTDPSQWDQIPSSQGKFTVLIDDTFGKTNVDENLRTQWEQKLSMMLPLIKMGTVWLIFALRTNIYLLCKKYFQTSELFKKYPVFEFLSTDISESDRLHLLDNHLRIYGENRKISEKDKMKIAQSSELMGFPYSCFLFFSNEGLYSSGLGFFSKPLMLLSESIRELSNRNTPAYLVLLLVMFYNNELPERVFKRSDRSKEDREVYEQLMEVCTERRMLEYVRQTAHSLCKTYLTWNDCKELFSFSHHSVYDSVFMVFCENHFRKGIEMCSQRTLHEYVRTQKVPNMDFIVFVSEHNFPIFAERLTKELFSGFSTSVVAHPAFKDSDFLNFLLNQFWQEETKVKILSTKMESQTVDACIYLYVSGEGQSHCFEKYLNYNTKPCALEPHIFRAFEYDTIIGSFVMAEADKVVRHLIRFLDSIKDKHLYKELVESLLACSFYRNKIDFVQYLIAKGGELSLSCFKAVCVSPNIHDFLVGLAVGVLEESDIAAKELQLLLRVCLENNKIGVAQKLIQSIAVKDGASRLHEVCLQILLLSHNGTLSWIGTSLRDGNLVVKLLEEIHRLGGVCSSDECVLLAAGCSDVSVIKRTIKYGGNVMCKSPSKKTPLHIAAQFGSLDVLQWLLLQKADTLSVDVNGWTPLHCAVQALTESSDKVDILLVSTCQIIGGDTALLLAVEKGDPGSTDYICREMQKRQLELGYPLHAAIRKLIHVLSMNYTDTHFQQTKIQRSFEVVDKLREFGLSLIDKDRTNKTPIHLVVESGNIEILSRLAEAFQIGVLVDLLHQSIKCGFPIMFKSILETFKNTIDNESVSMIHSVTEYICMNNIERGYTQVFSQILQHESAFPLNKNTEYSLLHIISKYGHLDLCSELLKKDAKVNAENFIGITHLHTAASYGRCEMVGFLIEKGANVNVKSHTGDTPLHCAAAHGHAEVVRCLLESKAEINVVNDTGETPVLCAIKHDHIAVVCNLIVKLARVHESSVEVSLPFAGKDLPKIVHTIAKIGNDLTKRRPEEVLLLQIGLRHCPDKIINCLSKRDDDKQEMDKCLTQGKADVIVTVLYSYTPLHDAARLGCIQMIKNLVERGADVNTTDLTNNTPLHNAVRFRHTEVMRYLIERGADLHITSKNSISHFYSAAERCHTETEKYRVEKDAGVDMMSSDSMNLFHIAVECGSTKKVKYFVEKGADVNMKSDLDFSPLYSAVEHGHIEIVKYLIQKGADVKMKSCGYSLLDSASKHGQIAIVKYLIKKGGADVNMKSHGFYLLNSATEHGHIEIVKYLVEKGADVNMKISGYSPLHSAVEHGHIEIVKYLVEKGADVSMKIRGYSPLHRAVEHGHIEIVKYLVEKGADVSMKIRGYSPLHSAVEHGHIEIVKYLVEKGADVNMKSDLVYGPLDSAVEHGHIEIVTYLVEKGAHVNMKISGYSPLRRAVKHGHIEIVKYLVEKGAHVNMKSGGYCPLHSAVVYGHIEIVKYLIEKGADVNMKSGGYSPLHTAVKHGHTEIVKYLVEKGADGNMETYGYSPFHSADEHGRTEMVKYPVEKGDSDVNMKSDLDYTSLHSAVVHGHIEIVKYLIEKGADVNMKSGGYSPLHTAVKHGHIEIVKYLVEKGANVNMKLMEGYSPLYSAAEHGHTEIIKYLVGKGADMISSHMEIVFKMKFINSILK